VEALLPEVGWVGFDPTNNVIAGQRHIRTAVGRDYADVPPTKGVFKGSADSQLLVAVSVAPSDSPPPFEPDLGGAEDWSSSVAQEGPNPEAIAQQQQQQQQEAGQPSLRMIQSGGPVRKLKFCIHFRCGPLLLPLDCAE
jgi:hypothetical protein